MLQNTDQLKLALNKLQAGAAISDVELNILIEFYTDLEQRLHLLLPLDFASVAVRGVREHLNQLHTFKRFRP